MWFMKKILPFWLASILGTDVNAQLFDNFITVSGNKLMDGTKEYRFLSYNIPNLNFVEDEQSFTIKSPYGLPTEFEIRDALTTIKQCGGQVARIYTIPVKRLDQEENMPAHVLGPGMFNEEAYKVNDMMLALANEIGIRIIFPIVNNWKWMGGRPQYAEFRGKTEDEFWTDPQLIEDVKKTIEYTLNRTNTITGVKYKDDKAILCWETGNELTSPHSWTIQITRYIKQLDKNHLVMDGFYAIDGRTFVQLEAILEPSIDIVSSHHYELHQYETVNNIRKNLDIINGRKPYIIGEFGFQSTTALKATIDYIISENNISGALIWSLRYHRESGGFYWHTEPMGLGIYKAYHWPGFSSGNLYDETNFVWLMREKAFEIQNKNVPVVDKPLSPVLLDIKNVFEINWKGSAGAACYNIERADNSNGPWENIAYNLDDAYVQYTSLYHDKKAEIGKKYFYRITAVNSSGISEPSNIVGPVEVKQQAVIDNMSNYSVFYDACEVKTETGDDRKFKEDMCRISGKKGSELIYYIPGIPVKALIYAFQQKDKPVLEIQASDDNLTFRTIESVHSDYAESNSDYELLPPILYECINIENDTRFLKIKFNGSVQISRVVIIYN